MQKGLWGGVFIRLILLGIIIFTEGCGSGAVTEMPVVPGYTTVSPTGSSGDYAPLIPDTTVVLDEAALRTIRKVMDGRIFTFEKTSLTESLEENDVIVGRETMGMPYGFLCKITRKEIIGDQVVLDTVQATLEDAVEQGEFFVEGTLSRQDAAEVFQTPGVRLVGYSPPYAEDVFRVELKNVVLADADNDYSTTYDQVVVNGWVAVKPDFVFVVRIKNFRLEELDFRLMAEQSAQLSIESQIDFANIHASEKIGEYRLPTFNAAIGTFPVWVTPFISFYVGLDGNVSVGISMSITETAATESGVWYRNNDWGRISPLDTFEPTFEFTQPTLYAGALFKLYAGPQIKFMLYGVAGPVGILDGFFELDIDLMREPWWELYGGVRLCFEIKVEVISRVVTSYRITVFDKRWSMTRAEIPPPTVTLSPTPTLSPSSTPGSVASSGQWGVLMTDVFDSNVHSWRIGEGQGNCSYWVNGMADGVYQFKARATKNACMVWSPVPKAGQIADFIASVECKQTAGTIWGECGLIFRWQDWDNYYYFGVRTLGYYQFDSSVGSKMNTLDGGMDTSVIRQWESNRITVIGEDDRFSCYINGSLVSEVYDGNLSVGQMGLGVRLTEKDQQDTFEFDNFQLSVSEQ